MGMNLNKLLDIVDIVGDRGAWYATVQGVAESDTTEQLNWTELTWIHLEINVLAQVADKWLYNFLGWLTENNK